MKLRVYFDTSVFSAYHDDRTPERCLATKALWERLSDFEVSTSEIARQELAQTQDSTLRERLSALLYNVTVHPLTNEMQELADKYVALGVFAPVTYNDGLHVAAAVITRQDILLSWNYRHLVNRRRRALINQVSITMGLPIIEIISPVEL